MDIEATANVYNDFAGLSALREQARINPNQTIDKVAGQFESIFLQMMLKSMRDASIDGGLFDSNQLDLYQSMFDQQVSLDLSGKGGLGMADIIVKQLSPQQLSSQQQPPQQLSTQQQSPQQKATTQPTETPFARPVNASVQVIPLINTVTPAAQPLVPQGEFPLPKPDWNPATPEAFIRDVWPFAMNAAKQLGVAPEVLVAQSALETGWGQKAIRAGDGTNSFNLFGIKADDRWGGDKARVSTLEFRDGIAQREYADFRAYGSVAQSFEDYVAFLQSSPRYQKALTSAGDGSRYLTELQNAGYATDPHYAEKIINILERGSNRDVFSELKSLPGNQVKDTPVKQAAVLKDFPEMPLFERETLASRLTQ